MSGEPAMQPNDAALVLLREMALETRETRREVSQVREDMAALRGMEIGKRLDAHRQDIDALANRLGALEGDRRADLAQRKPWVFIAGEIAKVAIAALVGFGAAIFGKGL